MIDRFAVQLQMVLRSRVSTWTNLGRHDRHKDRTRLEGIDVGTLIRLEPSRDDHLDSWMVRCDRWISCDDANEAVSFISIRGVSLI